MSEIQPLLAKLHRIAKAINHIEKRGENQHHHYHYAQAVDVVRDVRGLLLGEGLAVVPAAGQARHQEYQASRGGAAFLTTVDLCYRIYDVETGATLEVPWVGVGADIGGDKGIYKAYTGGLKYALLALFLIPTTDDPERDGFTEREGEVEHKDAARPAAPRIPADRAMAILMNAKAVDLATENGEQGVVLHPVLQAFLAQQGVEKIGALNVDQAETVEQFLREEAKPA